MTVDPLQPQKGPTAKAWLASMVNISASLPGGGFNQH